MQNKMYYRHSMYQGGLKVTSAQDMVKNKPERMIELAIHGMLPKNRLGDSMKTKLKVYAGEEHPHQAQQPEIWELRG
jgi:large subunit ribosomal protein L13